MQLFNKKETACLNCGARIIYFSAGSISVLCRECRTLIRIPGIENDSRLLSKFPRHFHKLPVNIGWEGTYDGERVLVIGRMRFAAGGRTMDEYCILSEGGRKLLLQVREGMPSLFEAFTPQEIIIPQKIQDYLTIDIEGENEEITGRENARVIQIDGECDWLCKKEDHFRSLITKRHYIQWKDNSDRIAFYRLINAEWPDIRQIFGKLGSTPYTAPFMSCPGNYSGRFMAKGCAGRVILIALMLLAIALAGFILA